jgi:hypothetical protein
VLGSSRLNPEVRIAAEKMRDLAVSEKHNQILTICIHGTMLTKENKQAFPSCQRIYQPSSPIQSSGIYRSEEWKRKTCKLLLRKTQDPEQLEEQTSLKK